MDEGWKKEKARGELNEQGCAARGVARLTHRLTEPDARLDGARCEAPMARKVLALQAFIGKPLNTLFRCPRSKN